MGLRYSHSDCRRHQSRWRLDKTFRTDAALSTLPPIHGTLFIINHAINRDFHYFGFDWQSWTTIVDNNRERSTETIVDVSKTHNRGRFKNRLFCYSDFIYILLINSKFSILQHLPTCSVTSILQHFQGFQTKGFLLVPNALKEMDVIKIARQSLQASSVG